MSDVTEAVQAMRKSFHELMHPKCSPDRVAHRSFPMAYVPNIEPLVCG